MAKKSGLLIGLAAVVTACPSLFCCFFGVATLAGGGTYEVGSQSGQMPPSMGLVFLALSLVPWLLFAGVWFFVRRSQRDGLE